jgi:hypothetical protein
MWMHTVNPCLTDVNSIESPSSFSATLFSFGGETGGETGGEMGRRGKRQRGETEGRDGRERRRGETEGEKDGQTLERKRRDRVRPVLGGGTGWGDRT